LQLISIPLGDLEHRGGWSMDASPISLTGDGNAAEFLGQLKRYAEDWHESRLPISIRALNIHGFDLEVGEAGRFHLVPRGMRRGRGAAREIECAGTIQSTSDPDRWTATVAIVPARHGWRNRWLAVTALAVVYGTLALASSQWQPLLFIPIVAPAYMALCEYNKREQTAALKPALEEMLREFAAGRLRVPVA
jgi:hypothetical protein